MSQLDANRASAGGGAFAVKVALCLVYGVACAVAENTVLGDGGRTLAGLIITAVVVVPLVICGLIYAAWWRRADEFQKLIEYRASARGALGGVFFLVAIKLASYFLPEALHIPSFSVVAMVLVYWVNRSHHLTMQALKP